jgi:hypothetical protein
VRPSMRTPSSPRRCRRRRAGALHCCMSRSATPLTLPQQSDVRQPAARAGGRRGAVGRHLHAAQRQARQDPRQVAPRPARLHHRRRVWPALLAARLVCRGAGAGAGVGGGPPAHQPRRRRGAAGAGRRGPAGDEPHLGPAQGRAGRARRRPAVALHRGGRAVGRAHRR